MKKHSMPKFEVRSLLLFSALALGTAFAAHAQQATSPCEKWAASGKPDAIAAISAARPASNAEAAFARADTNGDGKLDSREAEHFPAMSPHFQLIDTDHDQFLSREELTRGASSKS
ncbi:MAG: EF-hand domain-containing protein [Pseudomonadota bacterium]|nr:EF-hand domain-containing protein [Pseudomonadota bacterium]